jgi:hypothetical protein
LLFFNSYVRQKTQIENPFDGILSFNFDLGLLKVNNNVLGINFGKDYQKESYNKTHLMGKKFKRIKTC